MNSLTPELLLRIKSCLDSVCLHRPYPAEAYQLREELSTLLSQPAEHLPPLIQCLRENGQQIAERAFDAQEAKYPQPQPSAAQVLEFCCALSWKAAKEAASGKRQLNKCKCDHNEYCQHCFPPEFRKGGKWFAAPEFTAAPAHPAPRNEQAVEVQRLREALEGVVKRCSREHGGSGYVGQDGQYLKVIGAALSQQADGGAKS